MIPREFWKLIAFQDTTDRRFKAKAFVLSQSNLLNDLELLERDLFRLYEVSLGDLETRTGLDFSAIKRFSAFTAPSGPEAAMPDARPGVREILERNRFFA